MVRYLKLLVAALLIYWLIQSQHLDFSAIGASFMSLDQVMVAVALLLGLGVQIIRWFLILRMQGITIALRDTARVFWIGQLFFMTSFGLAGGEAARGYYIRRYAGKKTVAALSTLFIDRLLGLYTLTVLGSMAFLAMGRYSELPPSVYHMGYVALFIAIGITLFFFLLYHKRGRNLIISRLPESWQDRLGDLFAQGEQRVGQLPRLFLVSTIANIAIIVAFKLASDVLQTPIGWLDILLITPLVAIANSLPISFGGLGVGEAAAQALMAQVGIADGAAIMLSVRVTQWVAVLPVGVFFYIVEGKKAGS
jgi:glycosyltransferase 2 family protein